MVSLIDGNLLKHMIINAAANIENNKQQINELNVFPVPDGDTGTNMSLTVSAAADAVSAIDNAPLDKIAATAASAMLRNARGNSGVITSLLFRGFDKNFKEKQDVTLKEFALALMDGVKAAYKAVMNPAEGTILTVSRVTAETAVAAENITDGIEFFQCLLQAAKNAVDLTIQQNPVLKKAGVVDAGGVGFYKLLEGMSLAINGTVLTRADVPSRHEKAEFSTFKTEDILFTYCTEFIISRENKKSPELLRSMLMGIGDSLVLIDDDDLIKVHVHTNTPGKALEEAITYGSLVTVKVENMKLQHTEKVISDQLKTEQPLKKIGVVAVCVGQGMADLFHELGVDQIVEGGQTMNPSTEQIMEKVSCINAETVLILPNNKNIILAAQQIHGLTKQQIEVLPTSSAPEGIAAMMQFDDSLPMDKLIKQMMQAADQVETISVTYAARNSDYDSEKIEEGNYIALSGKHLIANEKNLPVLLQQISTYAASKNPDFITIFYGDSVSEEEANNALKRLQMECQNAEITIVHGGQPIYYYYIALE